MPETERLAEEIALVTHTAHLPEQERRVEVLAWNPVANDILAAGVNKSAKVFDVSTAEEIYGLCILCHIKEVQALFRLRMIFML